MGRLDEKTTSVNIPKWGYVAIFIGVILFWSMLTKNNFETIETKEEAIDCIESTNSFWNVETASFWYFFTNGTADFNIDGIDMVTARWEVNSSSRGSLIYDDGSRGSFSILDGCKIRQGGTLYD